MFADDSYSPISNQILDLTDPVQVTTLNTRLALLNTNLTLTVNRLGSTTSTNAATQPQPSCYNSVCYRPREVYLLSVENGRHEVLSRQFLSPNRAPLLQASITRAPFVKKTATLTFDNGFLTSQTQNKPSEAIGFIQMPIDVVKTIASIPAKIFKVRIDDTNNNATQINAQKSLIDAQTALIKAKSEAASAGQTGATP